jgi:phage gpG-like protein
MRPYELDIGWKSGDDPLLMAREIDLADIKLRALRVPLTQARRVLRDDIVERFDTETDPEGNKWEQWAESYRDRAEKENIGKLRKEPEYHTSDGPQLYDAISDLSSYSISSLPGRVSSSAVGGGDIALIGANLPDYWIVHQEGQSISAVTHTGDSYTIRIPARPFLGTSEEAEAMVYEIFDMHVERSLVGMVRSSGQPIVMTTDASGRRRPSFGSHFER